MPKKSPKQTGAGKTGPKPRGPNWRPKHLGTNPFRYPKSARPLIDYDYVAKLDPEARERLGRFTENNYANLWTKDGKDYFYDDLEKRKTVQNEVWHRRGDIFAYLEGYNEVRLDSSAVGYSHTKHESTERRLDITQEDALIDLCDRGLYAIAKDIEEITPSMHKRWRSQVLANTKRARDKETAKSEPARPRNTAEKKALKALGINLDTPEQHAKKAVRKLMRKLDKEANINGNTKRHRKTHKI